MFKCTAPIRGHIRGGGADCPACGPRLRSLGEAYRVPYSPYTPSRFAHDDRLGSRTIGRESRRTTKPRWSRLNSATLYTTEQVQALTTIRQNVEKLATSKPDLRDIFLCHAWDDRKNTAKELHDLLEANGVSVWFSEKDLGLGVPMMRAIDKGLSNSRIGIVLVTPAMLRRLPAEGIADKELSALLRRERLVPVIHRTTYEDLEQVSPLLASRSGLDTSEESLEDIAIKIAELVST